jgi:hypothetical protein
MFSREGFFGRKFEEVLPQGLVVFSALDREAFDALLRFDPCVARRTISLLSGGTLFRGAIRRMP